MTEGKTELLRSKAGERGYLIGDYKVFDLEETAVREIEYHYHTFDKILVFFGGNVEYDVGGRHYTLLPGDMVLVPRGEPHRLSVREGEGKGGYARMVIYLSPEYLAAPVGEDGSLRDCFCRAEEGHTHLLRQRAGEDRRLWAAAEELKSCAGAEGDGFDGLYQRTLLLRFLILLNRAFPKGSGELRGGGRTAELIRYINAHLTEDLSIDGLAERFYVSKYHMMRRFRAETGYTVGSYINQKRLLLARELLRRGEPVTRACLDAGFRDHSTFVRAYKKMFGELPSRMLR